MGTESHTNDAAYGNCNVPDIVLENAGSATNADTDYWHIVIRPSGNVTLLNKSGGRASRANRPACRGGTYFPTCSNLDDREPESAKCLHTGQDRSAVDNAKAVAAPLVSTNLVAPQVGPSVADENRCFTP
jgi:hypothetical protein